MARLPRLVQPGLLHLVLQMGRRPEPAFVDAQDAALYVDAMLGAASAAGVAIHGYSVQPHEVRILCTPSAESSLARMMQAVGRKYVGPFNSRHGQRGSPWAGRFRSTVVESGPHFLECLQLAEGMEQGVGASAQVLRSSAEHHTGGPVDKLISEHPDFWRLGNTPFERELRYRRLLEHPLRSEVVTRNLDAAAKGWALGSGEFLDDLARGGLRRPVRKAPGRPRKQPVPHLSQSQRTIE